MLLTLGEVSHPLHKVGEGWQDYHAARDIVQLKNFAAKTFVYDVWD